MLRAMLVGCVVAAAIVVAQHARACATHAFTVQELTDGSAQVIDGEIVGIRSYWTEDPRRIESEITLAGCRDLMNPAAVEDGSFTLIVPGGTVGDTTMRLCCGPELTVGQRWILFLQERYKTYPTVAMGQGLFRVVEDAAGERRVLTSGGAPVTGFSPEGVPMTELVERREVTQDRAAAVRPAGGGVTAVRVRQLQQPTVEGAMSLDAFVDRITPALRAAPERTLAAPAGQPLRPNLRATTLKRAPVERIDAEPAEKTEEASR